VRAAALAVVPVAAVSPAAALGDPAAAARTATVRVSEFAFAPARLTVRAGDRVRFLNAGRRRHAVAEDAQGDPAERTIMPRRLAPGAAQTVRLTRRGTVHYRCTLHPRRMRGVIVVI
jgi:plastocyanin